MRSTPRVLSQDVLLLLLALLLHGARCSMLEQRRARRQFDGAGAQHIDLNITVPYIFSARLYPYGETKEDTRLSGQRSLLELKHPILFYGTPYNKLYIRDDGAVGLSDSSLKPTALPASEPLIAVFWMPSKGGRVFFRESEEASLLNVAQSEVNIQYRYGASFKPRSVVIVTWEGDDDGNVFQLALLVGDKKTFAHFVYSRLRSNRDAIAGFSSGGNTSWSLPDSGTHDALLLAEKSDIGIPGEWLFQVDRQILLCGAGFKGLECIESCSSSQWGNDCLQQCHCEGGNACDRETGECPGGACSPGWTGEPVCDEDVDECEDEAVCPGEQPDCVNTPGAFLCLCFEYDTATGHCKGAKPATEKEQIPVKIVPLAPHLAALSTRPPPLSTRRRTLSTIATTTPLTTTKRTTTTEAPTTSEAPRESTETVTRFELSDEDEEVEEDEAVTKEVITCECGRNARCLPSGGCACLEGFVGDGVVCEDRDECFDKGDVCGPHSLCENTPGSFECSCEQGFIRREGACVDLNECEESPCGRKNSTRCVNLEGGYECRCAEGFAGNPSSGCADIDECAIAEMYCGPQAECHNWEGGFSCSCHEGFQAQPGSALCVDVDECLSSPCHPAAACTNLLGTFHCECLDGFVGDGIVCHETILFPIANDSKLLPRSDNALVQLPLDEPLLLFGHSFSSAYLSSNGVVSFERGFGDTLEDASQIRSTAFFPLHTHFHLDDDGLVSYTFVNDSDSASRALLTRSSLSIQNEFHEKDFHTEHLHIFTFDRLRDDAGDEASSFQVVLASGRDATFATFLYETVGTESAVVGISHPHGFVALPLDLALHASNVGQTGKWMWRVDGERVGECPAGSSSPPLCQQGCPAGKWGFECSRLCHCEGDIPCDFTSGICSNGKCAKGFRGKDCDDDVDECSTALADCSSEAECLNTRGAFECRCKAGFYGDGHNCTQPCTARFGQACSSRANCEDSTEGPRCVCEEGFQGDGLHCARITTGEEEVKKKVSVSHSPTTDSPSEEEEEETPFLVHNWVTETVATPRRKPTTASPSKSSSKERVSDTITVLEEDTRPKENRTKVVTAGDDAANVADPATILFIVIPAALCGVWLILIVAVVVVCCRKRRRNETKAVREVWNPPRERRRQRHDSLDRPVYSTPSRLPLSHFNV